MGAEFGARSMELCDVELTDIINSMLNLKSAGALIGSYTIKVTDARTGALKRVIGPIKNLIVASSGYGTDLVTRALGGDTTYQLEIDSAAIGSGSTAPTAADTGLGTSVLAGIAVASVDYPTTGQVILSFFIPDGDLANGTYNEFGIFANLRLFARSLITPAFTKGSNENTTVDYTITLTAS